MTGHSPTERPERSQAENWRWLESATNIALFLVMIALIWLGLMVFWPAIGAFSSEYEFAAFLLLVCITLLLACAGGSRARGEATPSTPTPTPSSGRRARNSRLGFSPRDVCGSDRSSGPRWPTGPSAYNVARFRAGPHPSRVINLGSRDGRSLSLEDDSRCCRCFVLVSLRLSSPALGDERSGCVRARLGVILWVATGSAVPVSPKSRLSSLSNPYRDMRIFKS